MKTYQELLARQLNGYHFYDTMGGARYDATEAQAQLENLIPSFTTIMGIKKNYGIEKARVNTAITTTLQLASEGKLAPIKDSILMDQLGEPSESPMDNSKAVEEMKNIVAATMSERGFESAEFGRRFHEYFEEYANQFRENGQQPCPGPVVPDEHAAQWSMLKGWFDKEVVEVYETEAVVVDLKGKGAGKIDLFCETRTHGPTLVDAKTQNVYIRKDGSPSPKFYDDWPVQLAKYQDGFFAEPTHEKSVGFNLRNATPANLVISSGEAINPVLRTYDRFELEQGRKKFDLMRGLWEMEHYSIEISTDELQHLHNRSKRVGNKEMKSLKEQCLGLVAKDMHKKAFNKNSYLGQNYELKDIESAVRICHGYPMEEGTRLPVAHEDLDLQEDPRRNMEKMLGLLIEQEEAALCAKYPAKDDPTTMNGTGKRRLESLKKRAHEFCDQHDSICTEMGIPVEDISFSPELDYPQKSSSLEQELQGPHQNDEPKQEALSF